MSTDISSLPHINQACAPEKIVEDYFFLDDAAVVVLPDAFSGDHRQDD